MSSIVSKESKAVTPQPLKLWVYKKMIANGNQTGRTGLLSSLILVAARRMVRRTSHTHGTRAGTHP